MLLWEVFIVFSLSSFSLQLLRLFRSRSGEFPRRVADSAAFIARTRSTLLKSLDRVQQETHLPDTKPKWDRPTQTQRTLNIERDECRSSDVLRLLAEVAGVWIANSGFRIAGCLSTAKFMHLSDVTVVASNLAP